MKKAYIWISFITIQLLGILLLLMGHFVLGEYMKFVFPFYFLQLIGCIIIFVDKYLEVKNE